MKKVLLVSPPNPFLVNPTSVVRLGLVYLATMLKNHGCEVAMHSLRTLDELESLLQCPYDCIGISSTTREYMDALQILNYCRREGHPATVVIGGAHATALPAECLRNGFDIVITGEADHSIVEVVKERLDYRGIIHAGKVDELDRLPIPDRRLAGSFGMFKPFMGRGQCAIPTTSILLSRGCRYQCQFCGPHFSYRRRSDENIDQELSVLSREGYQGLVIVDDLPFHTEQQVSDFCRNIGKYHFKFRCNFRADLLTPRITKMLADAGCCRLQFGIESANQQMLDQYKKGTNTTNNGSVIKMCHDSGIEVKAMFMFGLPNDNTGTAAQIAEWVSRYQPDSIQVSRYVTLPGSPLWLNGKHSTVTDYTSLNFFDNGGNGRIKNDLDDVYSALLDECRRLTYVDLGVSEAETMV